MSDFWKQICAWKSIWQTMLVLSSIILVLVVISLFITTPGSAAYYVTLFNVVFLVPTMLATLYVLIRCRREKR